MFYIAIHLAINMKRALTERNLVVVLFILVLIVFSFAERDSKKLDRFYTNSTADKMKLKQVLIASATEQNSIPPKLVQN